MALQQSTVLKLGSLGIVAFIANGCGSSAGTLSSGSTTPQAAIAAISTGVKTAGSSMAISALMNETKPGGLKPLLSSASCSTHGFPAVSVVGGNDGFQNLNDPNYPGQLTYCFMSDDTGDTVLGGFDTPTMVSCLVTQAGVTYDGVAHTETLTSAAIAACNMTGNVPAGTQITVTGSAPASFNSNYAQGVVLDMSATMGLTFKIATNVSGTKTSFLTQEHWAGAPGNNLTSGTQEGASAGAIDTSTGDLWYESRIEREGCASSSHSCGFNRHTRIHAVLTMSGTTPSGLSTISFAFGNLQYNGGDQSGDLGMLIESSGSLATGIKARLWEVWHGGSVGSSPTAATDYDTIGNWQEYTNTKCYTNASETSSGCGTGLPLFTTSTKFMLNTDDSHTSPASWVASITGQTFTNVNVDSDTQF